MDSIRSKCDGLLHNFPIEQIYELEARFKSVDDPYGSTVRFLAPNDKLMDIYYHDMMTLENAGITKGQIVDRLKSIIYQYNRKIELISEWTVSYSHNISKLHEENLKTISNDILNMRCNGGYDYYNHKVRFSNPIIIENRYIVTCISYWGYQTCPFIGGIYNKEEFTHVRDELGGGDDYWLYDLITGKTLQFNDLLIHLIESHGFFEGNVFHRLDPKDVINFFELKSGVNYTPKYITEERYIYIY
jgi:hypothetical protein